MIFFTLATLVMLSSAEQPSRNYLPQSQGQSQALAQGGFRGQGGFGQANLIGGERNTRPQQEVERSASILKQDQDADLNGNFQYSFETSNGIRAAEAGGAAQTQGEFSYQGDDGNTYTVTFSAGEGGFQASGAHLPRPPPTPADILRGLEQNARDEAAGVFDDGKYRPTGDDGQYRESPSGGNLGSFGQSHRGGQSGQSSGQFSQSSSKFSQSGFGSANRQGTFSPSAGYNY